MPKQTTASPPSFLRLSVIAADLGVHPATVRKWADSDQFPKPLRLSKRTHVWDAQKVALFLESQQEKIA